MTLWLEHYNELVRYDAYCREAEQHRLITQAKSKTQNYQTILYRDLHWFTLFLTVIWARLVTSGRPIK